MGYDKAWISILSFSVALLFCVPSIRRRQRQEIAMERLRIVSEALGHAEERLARSRERHDMILRQRCSFYLTNGDLEEALTGARKAMEEATEFARVLRGMQIRLISSFPNHVDIENQATS